MPSVCKMFFFVRVGWKEQKYFFEKKGTVPPSIEGSFPFAGYLMKNAETRF